MNRKTQCFISHSREDSGAARRIASFLSNTNNVEAITWADAVFDPNVPVFEYFREIVSRSDFFIILIPSEHKTPQETLNNIMLELGYLYATDKPLLPLFEKGHRSFNPSDLGGILYLEYDPENIENIFHYLQNWTSRLIAA